MCYSAAANFVGGGVLAAIGTATLLEVRRPREVLFASVPVLFAAHQLIEGVVWLGLDHRVSIGTLHGAAAAYVVYAQGLLPVLIPFSIWLMEPDRRRRRRMLPFVFVGVAVGLYVVWCLAHYDSRVFERGHSIVYDNRGTRHGWLAVPYVAATCGAMLFSGYGYVIAFGVANFAGLLMTMYVEAAAFTSIWCAYAAVASLVVCAHFRRQRALRSSRE